MRWCLIEGRLGGVVETAHGVPRVLVSGRNHSQDIIQMLKRILITPCNVLDVWGDWVAVCGGGEEVVC